MSEGGRTMDAIEKRIAELVNANGISGFEDEVRKCMEGYMASPVSDAIWKDRLGSLVGKKVGDSEGPRILVAGHMDEVGFMVTDIMKKGFLRFQTVGGWWSQNVLAHRVRIQSRDGTIHRGVIGSKPPHLLKPEEVKKTVELSDMFIDIGARDADEVAQWGIRRGDPIVPDSDFYTLAHGTIWAGKALDNRSGCALAIEVLHRLKGMDHPNIVFAGATVQEEVGLRGAETLARRVQPDIAFAVDVGCATDMPGFEDRATCMVMGQGPTVVLYDSSMLPHRGLRDFVMDTAEELKIPIQLDSMARGGTDGGKFHLTGIGCPTVVVGFPTRYIHSHNALMARSDFEQAAQLLVAVIERLDRRSLQNLVGFDVG
ncbi:M42 family metallopeptidase [Pasteuria penetrans]|uniref:M42 family metallopeptidase n=1 Tax=Pasteuria penetrans TaxID=86005 RepID=UPI001FE540CE|nr:M42 family metallopeptidase [Pasteuria penetrans]